MSVYKIFRQYLQQYTVHLEHSTQWALHASVVVSLAGIAWILMGLLNTFLRSDTSPPLPPGPKGKWFSPGPRAALKYEQLVQTYGPVFSYRQGERVIVVVGRYQAAIDIMQKHGGDTADRPRMIATGEIFSGGMRTLLTPAGERLQKLRKALHARMQPRIAPQYLPVQLRHAKGFLLDVINEPNKHIEHARRYSASVVMSMTYGKTTPTYYSDPEVQEVVRGGMRIGSLLGNPHIIDTYPFLRYIPWFTSTLRQWHREELSFFQSQVDNVRRQMQTGTAQDSFVMYLLDHQADYGLSDSELAYLAGSMFGAGAETTASAISFVVMAAATHPEEQAKLHAELDVAVGRDRLPSPEDQPSLPRVAAFYLEAFRWRPVSWGGFAHKATKDIQWENYVIPAGATVIGSHWPISKDPEIYSDPYSFKPDRWLTKDGQLRDDLLNFNYGFGRRVCVGQHVANNSLFLTTALLLWAFKISEDPSAPIDTMAFMDIANTRPLPFKATFEARVDRLKDIVETSLI